MRLWTAFRTALTSAKIPTQLLLTTYPQTRSRNVGDFLISQAFIELGRKAGVLRNVSTRWRGDPLSDQDIATFGHRPIFLPGMSVKNGFYPDLYALRQEFREIPDGLVPFGCSWQHEIGSPVFADKEVISGASLALLKRIVERTGPIAVRDHMIEKILTKSGVPAITVGDCGWYHLASHGKPMRRPKSVGRIAITTPHNPQLMQQSISTVQMARKLFPNADIRIVIHSKRRKHCREIVAKTSEYVTDAIDAAGDLRIFDRYEKFDLHIGHRLHGHIGFLRRRIPSVLLMEDARSFGFSTSIPTGCFSARSADCDDAHLAKLPLPEAISRIRPDENAVHLIAEFLQQEVKNRFSSYVDVAPYLDTMLEEVALPALQEKARRANSAVRQH